MPIPREQFDKELDQTENEIFEFLKQRPEKAYQCHEVNKGIGLEQRGMPQSGVLKIFYCIAIGVGIDRVLNELTKKGLVDKKIINGMSWYSIHRN